MEGCAARMETVLCSSASCFGRRPATYDDQEVHSAPSRLSALVVLVSSENAFPDSEIEFFISSTANFIHFGPREEVEESSDRWKHWTLGQ